MEIVRAAFKEWAAVVEMLGSGHQILLVRNFQPKPKKFLLHPTYGYAAGGQPLFNSRFKPNCQQFAKDAANTVKSLAQTKGIIAMNYWATVDAVIPVSRQTDWEALSPFFVWTTQHVQQYVKNAACIWLLRTNKLPNPVIQPHLGGGAITYYELTTPVSVTEEPVLTQNEFAKRKDQILSIVGHLPIS